MSEHVPDRPGPDRPGPDQPVPDPLRLDLRADCERCVGLCCVAPAFSASSDFAIDKPAGQPCPNLRPDFRCGIHSTLRDRGFAGCTVYDCFGAGQKVVNVTFGGQSWRESPAAAARMFEAFAVMRDLHELLWYVAEALTLEPARPLYAALRQALGETERLTGHSADVLVGLDVDAHRGTVNTLLREASELTRAGLDGRELRGADLVGQDLRAADLRGASLRGAYLIGADLRRADLERADLIGADLRGCDVRGANLGTAIFLTQAQVDTAKGDSDTTLPSALTRPTHWATAKRRRARWN